MSTKNDGGPAYPVCFQHRDLETGDLDASAINFGKSLRDWFAGQALAGMLSQGPTPFLGGIRSWTHAAIEKQNKKDGASMQGVYLDLAEDAYGIADAMLKAREQ